MLKLVSIDAENVLANRFVSSLARSTFKRVHGESLGIAELTSYILPNTT